MASLEQTALCEWHQQQGAKMVEFAGFYMPVNYKLGVMQEHLHTRSSAGLFDVSHMGQIQVTTKDDTDIAQVLESVFPANLQDLAVGSQCYSLLLNDQGKVVDDVIIGRRENDFLIVVNAGCKYGDLDYLQQCIGDKLQLELLEGQALLALQGPKAEVVLADLGADLNDLIFMQGKAVTLDGVECWVTRSGYTGEDGFEISLPNSSVEQLANKLVADERVEPIGLGARDSLRLEAGLCLYGHELSLETTPIEASLSWAIAKARRAGEAREGGFIGADVVLEQMQQSASCKRVGLKSNGRAPVREGAELFNEQEQAIGNVTSGGFSPSLQAPIAMGFVNDLNLKAGDTVLAKVRNKMLPMTITALPFVPNQYKR